MEHFQLFADPWWVNLLVLIPFAAYYGFRKKKLNLSRSQLLLTLLFGIAFGFVEAAVVVYLRAALGISFPQAQFAQSSLNFSASVFLIKIELFRETATLIMLLAISFLAVKGARERWAVFLWTFAAWDLFYYVFLWLTIRWPSSLVTTDVLFLIPAPWYAQVWFPLLVDVLMMLSIIKAKERLR